MTKFRALLAIVPLAALGACATAPSARPAAATQVAGKTVEISPGDSAYGLFLAGQAAVNGGHGETAAIYFSRAAERDRAGEIGFLDSRAFSAYLLAGDIPKAAGVAPSDPAADPVMLKLGVLTRGVDALASGQAKLAYSLLSGPDAGGARNSVSALLAPFAAAAAGDVAGATVHPQADGEPVLQFYATLDQGKLYEHFHRFDEAETDYRALIGAGDPGGIASLNLGELLERRGHSAEAAAIYDQALRHNAEDRALAEARDRVRAHKPPPPMPGLRRSAAEALVAPASVLIIQKQQEVALAYLRLALWLDPNRNEAWILVGDILSDIGDEDGARAAYLTPGPGSDEYVVARGKLAWTYQTKGDHEAALKIARVVYESSPNNQEAATDLADLLRADERFDESAKVLDPLIASQGEHADWRLLYMRAVDLQESGHWADAERDLTKALSENPDEPELLNFLGYSWIDRGERLPQALAMVKKAVSLDPRSGAMVDSLGWAYYRLGDYHQAVEQLESAVVLEAGDPEINDHLGDAYWRAGRRTEAQFQWRRVLTLEPPEKLKAAVETKLKVGLDAAAAPVAGS